MLELIQNATGIIFCSVVNDSNKQNPNGAVFHFRRSWPSWMLRTIRLPSPRMDNDGSNESKNLINTSWATWTWPGLNCGL